jgi:hypothetical protein
MDKDYTRAADTFIACHKNKISTVVSRKFECYQ